LAKKYRHDILTDKPQPVFAAVRTFSETNHQVLEIITPHAEPSESNDFSNFFRFPPILTIYRLTFVTFSIVIVPLMLPRHSFFS
jgi:hypothetical protein